MLFKSATLVACATLAMLAGTPSPGLASSAPTAFGIGAAETLVAAGYDGPSYRRHRNPPGYHVNRMGYGNYRPGPNGSFAGYSAGSAGAQIMRQQQEKKCLYAPESC